VASIK